MMLTCLEHGRSAIAFATILVVCVLALSVAAFDFQKSVTINGSRIDVVSCGAPLVDYPMLFSVLLGEPSLAIL